MHCILICRRIVNYPAVIQEEELFVKIFRPGIQNMLVICVTPQ